MKERRVRVLVVDDSAYIRKVISEMLSRSPHIAVVGTAMDGLEALERIDELDPDVVTLDLNMPRLDGLGVLKALEGNRRMPVIVVSACSEEGFREMEAVEAGAFDFVLKPTALANETVLEMAGELVEKVLVAGGRRPALPPLQGPSSPGPAAPIKATVRADIVVIALSTGGPRALRMMLPSLPASFPVPIAIVLHMPEGYTGPYAERLNELCELEVIEAADGMVVRAGRAIIARAGSHLSLERGADGTVVARLQKEPLDVRYRPSGDVLFNAAARVYGSRVLAVVMTGMGDDGQSGVSAIKSRGGRALAESEETCVVFGMPRCVIEAGLADRIVPLEQMVSALMDEVVVWSAG